jgi:hypothetical protein
MAAENSPSQIPLDKIRQRRHNAPMKLRRLVALVAVAVTLIAGDTPAFAEETRMNALQTALSSTTISGHVDTSVEWTLNPQPAPQTFEGRGFRAWWRALRSWMRIHAWH